MRRRSHERTPNICYVRSGNQSESAEPEYRAFRVGAALLRVGASPRRNGVIAVFADACIS